MTNQGINNVVVLDDSKNVVTHTVPVGNAPMGIAVRPPNKVYVANSHSGSVSVINTSTYQVIGTINVGDGPDALAVTPDGKAVYVANENSNSVSVIDTATDQVTATIQVGHNPYDVAITPDGKTAYVSNLGYVVGSTNPDNPKAAPTTISVIDTATNSVRTTISSLHAPQRLAISPDGKSLYAIAESEETTLAIINTADNSVTSEIQIYKGLNGLAVSPDGTSIYLTDSGSWGGNGGVGGWASSLDVVDTSTHAVTQTVGGTPGFGQIAVASDGKTAYFIDDDANSVAAFDTATKKTVTEVKTSSDYHAFPSGVAVGCMAQ